MSDARELLALLTCRVQRFHLAPGGIPNLTAEDIAHALGTIKNENARLYVRVKFAGQTRFADALACAIRRHIMLRKMDNGWRLPRPGFLFDLATLMLIEAIDPLICTTCEGTAQRATTTGSVLVCEACNGAGQRRFTESDRIKMLGINKSSWYDPWSGRYRDAQIEIIDKWEDIALNAMAKRLSGKFRLSGLARPYKT